MRKILVVVLLLLLVIMPMAGSSIAQDDEPIRIGLLVDQSGALTIYGYELEYGFKLGLLYEAGIDPSEYESIDEALAAVRIAGRPVEILVRDNGSVPDTASSQARELIEVEGVEVLVGAPSSGVTLGLQQVALDYEVVLFAGPAASPAITTTNFNLNTFRFCRNTFQDSLALASFGTELGENWLILAADYDFGRSSAAAFEATLSQYGVNFMGDVIYAPLETTDFTPYLQQILDLNPDVLLPIWAGDNSVALFQQFAELGLTEEMVIVSGTNSNDIVAVATNAAEIGNVGYIVYHYSLPDNEVNDWMVEQHIAYFPNPLTGAVDYPDLFTECGFTTAQAVVLGLEATEGDTLPEALIPALEGLSFDAPKGTIYMRPSDHQALVPMYIIRIDNLDDPEYRFFELVAEISAVDAAPPCGLAGDFAERCEMDAEFMESIMEMMESEG